MYSSRTSNRRKELRLLPTLISRLHLDTVGGMEVSADYPATTASILGKSRAADMLTLFTNGACGNINHIDVTTKRPQKGHEEAARIGTVLAG